MDEFRRKLAAFAAVAMIASGCGGGGGGGGAAAPAATTTLSHTASKSYSQRSIALCRQYPSILVVDDQTNQVAGRSISMRNAGRTALSTTTYNNEYDSETGCYLNGSITFTAASSTQSTVSGSVDKTSCDNEGLNGKYVYSGSVTVNSSTSTYFDVDITFYQDISTIVIVVPGNGTYNGQTDVFTPDSGRSLKVSGKDIHGSTYSNMTFTESTVGFSISGKVTDASGLAMTILSTSYLKDDGTSYVKFSTNMDISGVVNMDENMAGSATITQTSNSAPVLSATWNSSGAGTIKYADDNQSTSFTDCAFGCCGDSDCSSSSAPYCVTPSTSSAVCVQCVDDNDCQSQYSCESNACVWCADSHVSKACYNDDVYWYNGCGTREDKYQECGSSSCVDGACDNPNYGFSMSYVPTDVIADSSRNKLYASDKSGKKVEIIDLSTGSVSKTFSFTYMPERMRMSPDGTKLYVALLTREHSAYWFDEDGHTGYVAEIDLDSLSKLREIQINEDPFDIAVTSTGILVVTSGSGQHTYIRAYNLANEMEIGNAQINQSSLIEINPTNEEWAYVIDTSVSPTDITKYSVTASSVTELYDSKYHGDYNMWYNFFMVPDGSSLITMGGPIFSTTSGTTRDTDLIYTGDLNTSSLYDMIYGMAFDTTTGTIFSIEALSWNEADTLNYYNLSDFASVGETTLDSYAKFVFVSGSYVYVIREETDTTVTVDKFVISTLIN